jgi:hypothetical protein
VRQLRRGPGLAPEPLERTECVTLEPAQQLDRDRAAELQILGPPDFTDTASTQQTEQAIPPSEHLAVHTTPPRGRTDPP